MILARSKASGSVTLAGNTALSMLMVCCDWGGGGRARVEGRGEMDAEEEKRGRRMNRATQQCKLTASGQIAK